MSDGSYNVRPLESGTLELRVHLRRRPAASHESREIRLEDQVLAPHSEVILLHESLEHSAR